MIKAVSGEQGERTPVGRWQNLLTASVQVGAAGCLWVLAPRGLGQRSPEAVPFPVHTRGAGLLPLLCPSKARSHHRPG